MENPQAIFKNIKRIISHLEKSEKRRKDFIVHKRWDDSLLNLLHYIALRQFDLRELQGMLADLGLSSLGRCESNVMNTLLQVESRLCESLTVSAEKVSRPIRKPYLKWSEAERKLHQNSRDLFGEKPKMRHIYIMVTAPLPPQFGPIWLDEIILTGANLIRINCAHGEEKDWWSMIKLIRKKSKEMQKDIKIMMDLPGPKVRVDTKLGKKINPDDEINLHLTNHLKKKHAISLSIPALAKYLNVGERVFFDDGKAEGIITRIDDKKIGIRIVKVLEKNFVIKNEKGINFPDSDLLIDEITKEDMVYLDFVAREADIVAVSFAQNPKMIDFVIKKLKQKKKTKMGIIIKIETRKGFQNLPELLIACMQQNPCGVMIARGDLAIEVGYERMVEIQKEILWICEAAHIPVVWATQVLDNLAKTGIPSRAEVTDAASSVEAECVMLNKGPYIVNAIKTLDVILQKMELHKYKKRSLFRKLNIHL